jgi:hypothetical protein
MAADRNTIIRVEPVGAAEAVEELGTKACGFMRIDSFCRVPFNKHAEH